MEINASNIITEFREADMQAVVNNTTLGDLAYRNFFPTQFNPSLTFASLETTVGAKVMADIVAMGSKAPRKGRQFVTKFTGEIPKIEIARDMTEKDLYQLQQLRQAVALYPTNASVKNQLIKGIYEDAEFCTNGVNARLEWMAKQAASLGKYETTIANNSGGVANVKVDFGVSSGNATADWFAADPSAVKGITNIKSIVATAKAAGYSYASLVMDLLTFNQFVLQTEVQSYCASFASNALSIRPIPTLEQVNQALATQNLPTIRIWDSYIQTESKAGVLAADSGWNSGSVLFAVEGDLGSTMYTLTDEFRLRFGDTISQAVGDGFILVKSFGVQDPISVSTKATAFATPVLYNAKRNYILKTHTA